MFVSLKQVTVTPAPSLDFTLTPLSGNQYTSCLCGNERKTLRWTMAPSALGEHQAFIHQGLQDALKLSWLSLFYQHNSQVF